MKKFIALVLAGLMAFGVAACSSSTESTSGEATTTTTETKEVLKVRLGAQPTSGQVLQYIAEDAGFLAEEGVEVEMVYLSNLSDAASALNAEQVDVLSTYGTGGPLVQIANGQEWTIFGGYMIIGETPVYGLPEKEYKDLESFRGKKIGITRGGTPDVVLKGILYDAGFEIGTDVEFVEYKKNPDVLQAVANGEVDFGATATGYQLQAKALGLEVKMWPDELWQNHSCCRMFSTTDWLGQNEEALYRLLRAYIRAEEIIQDDAGKDLACDLLVENLDLTRETTETFVFSPHMKYDSDPFKNSVIKMWNKIFEFGYFGLDASVKDTVKIEEHMNTDIYEKAITSLVEDYPENEFFKAKLEQYNTNN